MCPTLGLGWLVCLAALAGFVNKFPFVQTYQLTALLRGHKHSPLYFACEPTR